MRRRPQTGLLKETTGVGALLLTIFATELAIMESLAPLFARLTPVASALLDASIIVLISAFPLWFFLVRPLPRPQEGEPRPLLLLFQALIGIFLVEYLIMLFLPQIFQLTGRSLTFADGLLTALGSSFFIWRFLVGLRRRSSDMPHINPPLRLYVLLLCSMFLSGLLEEIILPLLPTSAFVEPEKIAHAFLSTLLGAPLIWMLVVRPQRSEAKSQKARVAAVHAQVIDAIVTLDQNGVITSFNPAAEKLFGCAATQVVGESALLLFEDAGDGLERMLSALPADEASEFPPQAAEVRCLRSDGRVMIMNVSISELRLEERHPEFLLIMRDTTKRREMERALVESETRFREIFQQTEDAVIFFRPGGDVAIDANPNAEKTFGYAKEQLVARGMELVAEPDALAPARAALGAVTEGRIVQHDFLCRRGDGAQIVVSMRGKTMLLQGVPVAYCTFRDITERVRMEEKTREIQAKLIQTNKMTSLGLLVSGVAHEINNPNNFIMANSELLVQISRDSLKLLREYAQEHGEEEIHVAGIPYPQLEEHWMRLLDGILDGSRRVNGIVENLKGFARQERSAPRRDVDLDQVARSAVTLMHHELIKFTNNFRLELAGSLPPVTGHSQQLGQVIINLLMNACQALPDRQAGVSLATAHDPDRGEVVVTVRDEGCGMTPEQGKRIMEQFFTTRLESGGTGLGLSISESIVKEHGGRLEFDSRPGEGSTFRVRLPAAVRDKGCGGADAGAPQAG